MRGEQKPGIATMQTFIFVTLSTERSALSLHKRRLSRVPVLKSLGVAGLLLGAVRQLEQRNLELAHCAACPGTHVWPLCAPPPSQATNDEQRPIASILSSCGKNAYGDANRCCDTKPGKLN